MFEFIKRENPDKNVSEDYINDVEKKYGISFPKALRSFYLNHNVSELKEATIVMYREAFSVEAILPLKYCSENVEFLLDIHRTKKYNPQHLVPFAEDVAGELYYWDINTCGVYYWATGYENKPLKIARSVDEFFELLNIYCD